MLTEQYNSLFKMRTFWPCAFTSAEYSSKAIFEITVFMLTLQQSLPKT